MHIDIEKDAAANRIQAAICNLVCSRDIKVVNRAKRWLLLTGEPQLSLEPFISDCDLLGIDWKQLRESLREAEKLTPKPKLVLVHSAELSYSAPHEGNSNSSRISETTQSK